MEQITAKVCVLILMQKQTFLTLYFLHQTIESHSASLGPLLTTHLQQIITEQFGIFPFAHNAKSLSLFKLLA